MSKKEKTCPLGHSCDECKWDVTVIGTNPQTGDMLNESRCAMSWLPLLLIETTKEVRQSGASIDSFRNEMVRIEHGREMLANNRFNEAVGKFGASISNRSINGLISGD